MADPAVPPRPILNPVLSLRMTPTAEQPDVRGKREESIVVERLATQRQVLAEQLEALYSDRDALNVFGGKFLLVAEMFPDSYAFTHTPDDLFQGRARSALVMPMPRGYLVELEVDKLRDLAATIRSTTVVAKRCDISRVKAVRKFAQDDVLRSRSADELWNAARQFERGRGFIVWLAPFFDDDARAAVVGSISQLGGEALLPTYPRVRLARIGPEDTAELALPVLAENQSSVAIAIRDYIGSGHARAVVQVPTREALNNILASGGTFRIEPVNEIGVSPPGEGEEPGPLPPPIATAPIIGLVDGGRTATRYDSAEAWREPGLIPQALADTRHGNQITSLGVHGHAWNNNLPLPELYCRVGIVPAVPRHGSGHLVNPAQLIAYLDAVLRRHPDTKVWNLSFNELVSVDPDYVSFLGHELALLSRRHRVLFVISVGNVKATRGDRLAPPADCEAALVVGGRKHLPDGSLAGPCEECLSGPGPQGQLRPDVSFYSTLRVLGGITVTASSYPTALVSALGAHTFENLKDPSPDMVRALILNQTDLRAHEPQRGWGSPNVRQMPWLCEPGGVTLAWHAKVKPGLAYYWEKLPIPKQLIQDGRLKGRGSLTVVLNPLVNDAAGANYYATRITAALQYNDRNGETTRLLGSLDAEDTAPELDARTDYQKWQPIRRDARDFSKRQGLGFSGEHFRLYARAYTRDLYNLGHSSNKDIGELEAAIVLTLSDGSNSSDLYNSMTVSLGNLVESAVLDQEIDIEQ